jgi:nicotinate-nucleotide pyrophosphorylase (carboxylating)
MSSMEQAAPPDISLPEGAVNRIVEEALREDIGLGDVTTEATVHENVEGDADLLAKEAGVVAGLEIASSIFYLVDERIHFEQLVHDGEKVAAGTVVARVHGPLPGILKGERTALNFLQRMSGIATLTAAFVEAVRGTRAHIIDTRKTAPGLRALDKLAVRYGGGFNHRFGLDDMMLIKDNHIAACAGNIRTALFRARDYLVSRRLTSHKVEIETKNLDEVKEVLRLAAEKEKGIYLHRIMLDNFPVAAMKEAVVLIGRRLEVEASGGITLANVRAVAETGVDFISVGALTHSPKALDISLNIVQRASA